MIGSIIDMILFPVSKLIELLQSDAIESYLGVSVLGIAVTVMITFIVFRALVSTVASNSAAFGGSLARSSRSDRIRREKELRQIDKERHGPRG